MSIPLEDYDPVPLARREVETRITDPVTGGQKGQKTERYDLIPWGFLDEVSRVYGVGCRKYEARNWEKGYSWGLSIGALFRHVSKWIAGESIDPESGLHHLAHACFHLATLFTYEMNQVGTDDRSKLKGRKLVY